MSVKELTVKKRYFAIVYNVESDVSLWAEVLLDFNLIGPQGPFEVLPDHIDEMIVAEFRKVNPHCDSDFVINRLWLIDPEVGVVREASGEL